MNPSTALRMSETEQNFRLLSPERRREAVEIFRRDGALVLEDAFDPAFVATLHDAYLERYVQRGEAALADGSLKVGDRRLMVTVDVRAPFNDPRLYANGLVYPILSDLLEGDCVLNGVGSVVAFPGAKAQGVHRDHPYLFRGPLAGEIPPYAITLVLPLVDLTPETGTTEWWEGSHRDVALDADNVGDRPPVQPYCKRGSAYFMDYRLLHAGQANRSAIPRPIMYVVYSRGWFVDDANYARQKPLALSPEDREAIPEAYRPLFVRG